MTPADILKQYGVKPTGSALLDMDRLLDLYATKATPLPEYQKCVKKRKSLSDNEIRDRFRLNHYFTRGY